MFEAYHKDSTFRAFEGLIEYMKESHQLIMVTVRSVSLMNGVSALTKVPAQAGGGGGGGAAAALGGVHSQVLTPSALAIAATVASSFGNILALTLGRCVSRSSPSFVIETVKPSEAIKLSAAKCFISRRLISRNPAMPCAMRRNASSSFGLRGATRPLPIRASA